MLQRDLFSNKKMHKITHILCLQTSKCGK